MSIEEQIARVEKLAQELESECLVLAVADGDGLDALRDTAARYATAMAKDRPGWVARLRGELAEAVRPKGPMVRMTWRVGIYSNEKKPDVEHEFVRLTPTQVVLREPNGKAVSYKLKDGYPVDRSRGGGFGYYAIAEDELERVRAIDWKPPKRGK